MNKLIKSVMVAALLFGGGSLIELPAAHAQGSATVGSIRGQIRDKANGEAAVGATVVATSPSLQGEQVVITEDGGQYFITSLPPGLYVLTVYYNDATFSRGNVVIQVGKEAVVNVTVDSAAATGKPKGETIVIKGSAPIVDQGSTKTGMTITDDYTRNIPTGRTFGAVVGAAAGAQSDNFGISFAGSTSGENTYIVEGINTTDTGFGGIASNLPNEFIEETEVITGGYNAEFGRATGGIVNVVTKSGSNEFRGSVFSYVQPGSFVSAAKEIDREGGSIASKTDLDYKYDVGAELGGPIIKDKLWFHVGFNPSVTHETEKRIVQTQVDMDQNGIPDKDANDFTVHKQLTDSEIPIDLKTYFFTAKINGAVNQNNQFQISAFGNPRVVQDVFTITRNPSQTRWKYDDGAYDFAGKWTSKLNGGKTQIDAVVGYHRGYTTESPYSAAQDVPTVYYNYERSLNDFADLEGSAISACNDNDPNDPFPKIRNCPVTAYTEQGLSLLEKKINDRTSAALSVTHRVKLGPTGYHVFKAGLDLELAGYTSDTRESGGAIYRRSANTAAGAPGAWQLREFFKFNRNLTDEELMDPSSVDIPAGQALCANDQAICERADHLPATTTNRNIGAYAQDQWQLRPNFTINAGLRYEQQVGYAADELAGKTSPEGEIISDRAYTLNNLIAPRLGFIFDPTKEGKSKIFGHYGRFYENVPMDLNVRAFGGEITNFEAINATRKTPAIGGYDPNCDVDHSPGQTGQDIVKKLDMCGDTAEQAALGGGIEFVSPGMRGQRTDEIILGAEYEFQPDFKIGATFQHRTLPIVIEDISVDGGNNYLITNPGQNFDDEADKLHAQATQLMASTDPKKQALGDLYESRAQQMYYVKNLEKPVRNYDALQLTLTQRPTKKSLLIATYTYSQSKGNYPGLFSTETGQNDPNITSLYDLPDLMANRYGPLGLDRPHNFKVDGFYVFDLKKAGQITTGASFRAQSGIAHNVLGESQHPGYGEGESYLLPRGAAARSPLTTEADIRVSYGYKINKHTLLEGFVNVFNLFDEQEQLNQDENYTLDFVNPILGGDMNDVKHVKTLDELSGAEINTTPIKNKNYGHTGTNNANVIAPQQTPRTVQLGFRLTF